MCSSKTTTVNLITARNLLDRVVTHLTPHPSPPQASFASTDRTEVLSYLTSSSHLSLANVLSPAQSRSELKIFLLVTQSIISLLIASPPTPGQAHAVAVLGSAVNPTLRALLAGLAAAADIREEGKIRIKAYLLVLLRQGSALCSLAVKEGEGGTAHFRDFVELSSEYGWMLAACEVREGR